MKTKTANPDFEGAPINWPAMIVLTGTSVAAVTVLPAYLWFFDPAPWL